MTQKILIIDDDPLVLELVQTNLEAAGYEVATARDGIHGLRKLDEIQPNLIILDVMMPEMDGWETYDHIQALSLNIPVVVLTGLEMKENIVEWLNMGADDYVVKPFFMQELRARVEAVLRRRGLSLADADKRFLSFGEGELTVDPESRQVTVRGEAIHLTPMEYNLLLFLVKQAGRIISTNSIFDNVWPYDTDAGPESVKWYIWRLRKKIEVDPYNPRFILTEHGFGYRFMNL